MAQKHELLVKSQDYGPCMLTFDMTAHTVLCTSEDIDLASKLDDSISKGYGVLALQGATSTIFYTTKEPDGFVRQVTKDNWDRNMHLWVFENDPVIWANNVDAYFEFLMADEESKKFINDYCKDAIMTTSITGKPFILKHIIEDAKKWLKQQGSKKRWASGKRRSDVWKFLFRSSLSVNSMGWIQREHHKYMKENSQEYRNKLFGRYGKKKW